MRVPVVHCVAPEHARNYCQPNRLAYLEDPAMIRRIAASALLLALLLVASTAVAEDKYFNSDGVKIRYAVEGSGEPVVLVHGFTANVQMQWGLPGIITKLKDEYQVIALDNRGHGKSDKPHDPKQYGPEMVKDVVRLMDHLNIAKAHVVGYSMGGFLTNYLVNTYPNRVITATLGGAGWSKPDDSRTEFMTQLADSLDAGKGIGPLVELLTPPGQPRPDAQQLEFINKMILQNNDPKALSACIRGLRSVTVTEAQLKANKVPTLCLIGTKDPLQVGVDELAEVMANVRIIEIEDADHMTAFSAPEFIGGLKEFLETHSAEPAAVGAGGGK
jgi:pimeloyl-ACP methyl ester carboxylesterase